MHVEINRNIMRVRYDRTIQIRVGMWSSDGQKEKRSTCCHFRYLNSVTVKDTYTIPRIDESLSKLWDAKFCTFLDLGLAFWQVPLRKQAGTRRGLLAS